MKKKVQIGILMVFLLTGCQIFQSHADKMRAIGEKVEEQGWEVEADTRDNAIYVKYTLEKESNEILTFFFEKMELGSGDIYNKGYIAFRKKKDGFRYGILYTYKQNEQFKYTIDHEAVGSIYTTSSHDMVCRSILDREGDDGKCGTEEQTNELKNQKQELDEMLNAIGIDKEEFMDYVYWKYVPEGQQNKEQN